MSLNPNDRSYLEELNGWQPRQSDVDWTRSLIERMADGGRWGIPMNRSVWRMDKTNKVFKCVHGAKDDLFDKLTKVCAKLGYTTALALEDLPPHVVDEHLRGTGKTTNRITNPGIL